MSTKIKDITAESFQGDVLERKGLILIDFWAPWCGPCKALAPKLESLAEEKKELAFGKINIDSHPDLAARSSVRGIPTLVLYRDGSEVGRVVGNQSKE
jgi:thioredoxin 1